MQWWVSTIEAYVRLGFPTFGYGGGTGGRNINSGHYFRETPVKKLMRTHQCATKSRWITNHWAAQPAPIRVVATIGIRAVSSVESSLLMSRARSKRLPKSHASCAAPKTAYFVRGSEDRLLRARLLEQIDPAAEAGQECLTAGRADVELRIAPRVPRRTSAEPADHRAG
jgi:hypothetical protein